MKSTTKQTRGRPKKTEAKRLPDIYRLEFTEHNATTYGLFLMYVMEIFANTKQQKRVGHSEGSFTVYDKIQRKDFEYSFDSFDTDVKQWGCEVIFKYQSITKFSQSLVGIAPKAILRQLLIIIRQFLERKENLGHIEAINSLRQSYTSMQIQILNQNFKYIRFIPESLKLLGISQKWVQTIAKKVNQLWDIFIYIFTDCILQTYTQVPENRFYKQLFSDADHPQDTIIGQSSLRQIMDQFKSAYEDGYNKTKSTIEMNHSQYDFHKQIIKCEKQDNNYRIQQSRMVNNIIVQGEIGIHIPEYKLIPMKQQNLDPTGKGLIEEEKQSDSNNLSTYQKISLDKVIHQIFKEQSYPKKFIDPKYQKLENTKFLSSNIGPFTQYKKSAQQQIHEYKRKNDYQIFKQETIKKKIH